MEKMIYSTEKIIFSPEIKASAREFEASAREIRASAREFKASAREIRASTREFRVSAQEITADSTEIKADARETKAFFSRFRGFYLEIEIPRPLPLPGLARDHCRDSGFMNLAAGFNPRKFGNRSLSRQRQLNKGSSVADATLNIIQAYRGLKPTAKFRLPLSRRNRLYDQIKLPLSRRDSILASIIM
ncbi:MAG: hypothetical protein WKF92_00500 [Pyrinomonadaceae bacterium]